MGLGLKSIEARANEFNGKFTIDTAPGVGTTVHLEFSVDAINKMSGVNSNKIYS
jgi:signal transduction histidine kinase